MVGEGLRLLADGLADGLSGLTGLSLSVVVFGLGLDRLHRLFPIATIRVTHSLLFPWFPFVSLLGPRHRPSAIQRSILIRILKHFPGGRPLVPRWIILLLPILPLPLPLDLLPFPFLLLPQSTIVFPIGRLYFFGCLLIPLLLKILIPIVLHVASPGSNIPTGCLLLRTNHRIIQFE